MKQKHIVMVSHDFLPNIGGIAVYVYELSKALVARGHRLTVLSQYRSFSTKKTVEEIDGIQVIRIPIAPIKKWDDVQYRKRMRQLITELEATDSVDIIHWQTLNKDAQMMRDLDVQALEVYTNHLSWFRMLYNEGNTAKIYALMKEPDVIICPSREVETMTSDLFHQARTVYVPNGVDEQEFYPNSKIGQEVREQYRIAEQDTVIVSTNRMEPVKGMRYLMDIIPNILKTRSNVTFLIAGDGSQYPMFQAEITKKTNSSAKVIFTGRLTNQEVKRVINAADIYVQPSLMEGCSIAIIEAMACGKPVIAANVGGNPDIISDETGILVPPKSAEALQTAIYECLDDPNKRQQMGIESRKRVEQHLNWRQLAQEIDHIYDSVKR
ncbi:glycosyltransferase family 4 protein [Listeria booriae]|uniref:Glycosyl transferase family 1 n=1 Tax=Listeria booriae TaxID=1552123 RepID=A0A099VYV7_9LIST|nr:glycosyltransferase family 4 protein [Listeria booriae]KGL37947.1 glycosyl transferase family 1 [Listeria booriae]STY45944.1 GDP-mannose-dependent alpha-(1-6)-phosphatidylinositol monomannoside mannosyltransferase [Listeria booriae]